MIKRLVNKSYVSNQLMQIRDHQSPPFTKTSPAVQEAVAASAAQNTTPKKKSSPFNMDKLLRKFFNKPTVEVVATAAPIQSTVYKNEAFGMDSSESEQQSKSSTRNRTVSCGRQQSDFIVENTGTTSFSSLTVSPQVDIDLNDIKMR
jgi:hypothetical protein